MTHMNLTAGSVIAVFFLMITSVIAGELPNGYGGVAWGGKCPPHFKVMMEDTVRGQKFQIALNPSADKTFGGISFDQVVYRFVGDKLAMVSFVKSGADINWYQSNKPIMTQALGAPSQVMDNRMMEIFQTYWKSDATMGCFEWNEGYPEDGEPESVSFTLTPAAAQ